MMLAMELAIECRQVMTNQLSLSKLERHRDASHY